MLYTPHALVGATIAYVFPNPAVALPLSLVSHLLFDVAPHTNPSPRRSKGWSKVIMGLEVLIGTIILILYSQLLSTTPSQSYLMFLSGVTANLPDLMMIPYVIFKRKCNLCIGITKFQKLIQTHVSAKWGYPIQIALIILLFLTFSGKLLQGF